jgi:hypothetical protein
MKLKSALTLADVDVVVGGIGRDATETAGNRFQGGGSFHWLRQFVERQIVGTAPEAMAICEFDCRKVPCTQDEWETCERRIHKGAGELFPRRKPDL